ncbi:unnamed protein product [Periconia digitata]|uniref:Uncharacterized protein n=1 Tax=Periconia digitata TaxID=1303443 RepID=A0A9W4ULY5_9PLEO|nr:unnamed protein product [Periconia digitata]
MLRAPEEGSDRFLFFLHSSRETFFGPSSSRRVAYKPLNIRVHHVRIGCIVT